MEAKNSMLQSKDSELLCLLNQIASDMVMSSDVDEIVKNAVAEEHDRMVTFYEEKMKKMAAEYEAVIASLKKKDKGGKKTKRQCKQSVQWTNFGGNSHNTIKKIFDSTFLPNKSFCKPPVNQLTTT